LIQTQLNNLLFKHGHYLSALEDIQLICEAHNTQFMENNAHVYVCFETQTVDATLFDNFTARGFNEFHRD
jgi:hypothetical protein